MKETIDLEVAIANFQMPKANPGLQILWYKRGVLDRTSVEVAYMLHAGGRTAVILTASGRRLDAVRHVDDPKLTLSVDQRENGAWDFTEDYKEQIVFRQEIAIRLQAIEEILKGLGKDPLTKQQAKARRVSSEAGKQGASLSRYHATMRKAKELGLPVSPGMSQEAVAKLIENATPVAVAEAAVAAE